jgi:hypothetical protein
MGPHDQKGGDNMRGRKCRLGCLLAAVWILLPASAGWAGLDDQLAAYSGDNAKGYLKPLSHAIGADLNNGLFQSSYIPVNDVYASFEIQGMAVWFSDDDRTFTARTDEGFTPSTSVKVPTVVGPGEAVSLGGDGGTTYMFPGGFDLSSFALSVPQIRFGSYRGTEGLFRYLAADLGGDEFGDLSLVGFGLRHSISQYLRPDFPVSLAGGFFWQRFRAGENKNGGDILRSTAWTIGVQGGRVYGSGWATIEPYAGLSLDSHKMDVHYTGDVEDDEEDADAGSSIDVSFDPTRSLRFTLGFLAELPVVGIHAEYSIAKRNSFAFGLALGKFQRSGGG